VLQVSIRIFFPDLLLLVPDQFPMAALLVALFLLVAPRDGSADLLLVPVTAAPSRSTGSFRFGRLDLLVVSVVVVALPFSNLAYRHAAADVPRSARGRFSSLCSWRRAALRRLGPTDAGRPPDLHCPPMAASRSRLPSTSVPAPGVWRPLSKNQCKSLG
jgi:hypothetical protein